MKHAKVIACAVALLPALAGVAQEHKALVQLPFDNLSGVDAAMVDLTPLVAQAVAAKGWRVINSDQTEALLEKERVRYLDSLAPSVRTSVLEASGATALLTGTIYRYAEGRHPVVALSARLVRGDGTLAWADVASLSTEDTHGLFGFGKKATRASLGGVAVRELMRRFPASLDSSVVVRGPAKPLFRRGPVSVIVPGSLPHAKGDRICILPLENRSSTPDAARIVTDLLAVRLAATGDYTIVEPATVRAAALDAHVGSFTMVRPEALARLGQMLGATRFVRGTVFDFVDPSVRYAAVPSLDVELAMIDIAAGRVVWAAQHARSGEDYTGVLLLGTVNDAVSLADRVVSEIVAAEAKAINDIGTPRKSARATLKRNPEKSSRLTVMKGSEVQPGDTP